MKLQKFSYHTHTDFSDGANTLDEMLAQAVKLDWEEIGISNHFQIHKDITKTLSYEKYKKFQMPSFGQMRKPLENHIKEIEAARKKYPIRILAGLEVDYFSYPGWEEQFRAFIKDFAVDYLILGSHYCFGRSGELMEFKEASEPEHVSNHFKNMKKGIESKLFDFVAHIDYLKKYSRFDVSDFKSDIAEVIDSLAKTGTCTELNSKGFLIGTHGQCPADWILKELKKREIPIAVSDDSHNIGMLGIAYEQAENLLSELNYNHRWKFE